MARKVMIAISRMDGGGAERVISILANQFYENGFDVRFVVTQAHSGEIIRAELREDIEIECLQEQVEVPRTFDKIYYSFIKIISRVLCSALEACKLKIPTQLSYQSFIWQHYLGIRALRKILTENPEMTVIAFLQPTIPIVLLAAKGLPNKIIISERANPHRLIASRYGVSFIKKYYKRADKIVFQTEDARNVYPAEFSDKSCIIHNPIKNDLPEPFNGERKKYITTFCRISAQKNLFLLIDAFNIVHKKYADFRLKIIGNAPNEQDKLILEQVINHVKELDLCDYIDFLPFSKTVHADILEDYMYVNSSDYEGMSNSMLEAMAIGLPTICTDCPIGGARTIIDNGVNGLLVPVGNVTEMANAMCSVVEDSSFATKLTDNGSLVRERLSSVSVFNQWLDLV